MADAIRHHRSPGGRAAGPTAGAVQPAASAATAAIIARRLTMLYSLPGSGRTAGLPPAILAPAAPARTQGQHTADGAAHHDRTPGLVPSPLAC